MQNAVTKNSLFKIFELIVVVEICSNLQYMRYIF